MRKPKPPISRRWCVICESMTKFIYNPNIGHSECNECGGRFANKNMPLDYKKPNE